jgi:hypothetical protein
LADHLHQCECNHHVEHGDALTTTQQGQSMARVQQLRADHEKPNEGPDLRSGLALARNSPSWYGPSAPVKVVPPSPAASTLTVLAWPRDFAVRISRRECCQETERQVADARTALTMDSEVKRFDFIHLAHHDFHVLRSRTGAFITMDSRLFGDYSCAIKQHMLKPADVFPKALATALRRHGE